MFNLLASQMFNLLASQTSVGLTFSAKAGHKGPLQLVTQLMNRMRSMRQEYCAPCLAFSTHVF